MPRLPNQPMIASLRREIASGRYEAMAFLPSERQLAEEFGVGRGVVRNAVRALQEEGLLQVIPHRGVRVAALPAERRFRRFMLYCAAMPTLPHELLKLLSGVCCAASEIFAEVLVAFHDADRDPARVAEELQNRIVRGELHGVILAEEVTARLMEQLRALHIPAVVANQENQYSYGCCRLDYRGIGRMAGSRIAAAGHRRIGVVAGALDKLIFREMLAGFRGALAEEEIALDPADIYEILPTFRESCLAGLRAWLKRPDRPTALFAMRDVRAQFCYRACAELDLRIPEDISIVGFDNISWPEGAAAGLTTIRQPMERITREAVLMLKNWYESSKPPASKVLVGEWLERRSLAAPPASRRG